MSIIDQALLDNTTQNQMLQSSNCISTVGCYPYYPQPTLYQPRQVTVEAVENGFIVSGTLRDKGSWRTVAISAKGLADILMNWCSQFEVKAK